MFDTRCTSCGKTNQIPPHYRNRSVRCSKCGNAFLALEDGDRHFKFNCSECRGGIEAEIRMRGQRVECPHCNQNIVVGSDPPPKPAKVLTGYASANVASLDSKLPTNDQGSKRSKYSPTVRTFMVILAVLIATGGFVAFKKASTKAAYKRDLEKALDAIVSSASNAEEICQSHAEAWKAATESRYEDIDSAIKQSVSENRSRIGSLGFGKTIATSLMNDLKDPPEEYSKVYDKLVTIFGLFISFADLAVRPSGSLISYTQNFLRLQEDLLRGINEIHVMMPK